jgi:hypothetical protein
VQRSRRQRWSDSLFLLALSLFTFAGVNVSESTRDVLLAMGAGATAISLWLSWSERKGQQVDGMPWSRRRLFVLTAASLVSWGGLGLAVAFRVWAAAAVAVLAAAWVTLEIWRSSRSRLPT